MRNQIAAAVMVIGVSACATAPDMPADPGVAVHHPAPVVQQAAVDALSVTGFDIERSEPLYVQGFRPRKVGLLVGSGGETIGIWLKPVAENRTMVNVSTQKSFVGIVGQKDWSPEVLAEMQRTLARR